MEFSRDFDLDTAAEKDLVLILKPQVRFLWQYQDIQEEIREKATEMFGIPFETGFDGVCLHEVRFQSPGWWQLTVKGNFCRVDFGDRAGLRAGLEFWLSRLRRTDDGRLYIAKEIWTCEKGKVVKMMKKMDMHIHTYADISVDQMVAYMTEMMQIRGYCGLGFVSLLHQTAGFHPEDNNVALELKARIPGTYAFANMDHGKDFVEQAKSFMEQGFDGIKMLEGKPSEYRFWGTGYEGPRMDKFFAYAEEQQIPLIIHNNDPRANWDVNNPKKEHLKAKGWFYGEEDLPSQEEFFRMLEGVFERHPNLRAAISHMGFYYDDLPRVSALLDACPNLYLDMTPAVEVFMELSEKPEESAAFIRKYSKRMFWGTDTSVNWAPGSRIREFNDQKVRMMEVFFEGTEPEVVAGKYPVTPIRLEPELLEDIYYYNALRFMKKI